MKKLFLLLAVAVIFAACKQPQDTEQQQVTQSDSITAAATSLMIGVIDTDSILENYAFAVKARNDMSKKADEMTGSLRARATQLQSEYADFQKKIENNAFLSRERAEQEAQRIQKKEQDLQKYQENMERTFMQEQQSLSIQLKDSIDLAIKAVNKDKRFAIVLSTSSLNDNVLYVEPNLNITKEILEFLNKRYK